MRRDFVYGGQCGTCLKQIRLCGGEGFLWLVLTLVNMRQSREVVHVKTGLSVSDGYGIEQVWFCDGLGKGHEINGLYVASPVFGFTSYTLRENAVIGPSSNIAFLFRIKAVHANAPERRLQISHIAVHVESDRIEVFRLSGIHVVEPTPFPERT